MRRQRKKTERNLAVIRLATAFRCQFAGADGSHRLDLGRLDPGDAGLIGDGSTGSALVLDESSAGLTVALESETPRFSGEVQEVVEVADRTLYDPIRFVALRNRLKSIDC